jgi:hypothetical protein
MLATFNGNSLLRNLKQSFSKHNVMHRLQMTETTSIREKSACKLRRICLKVLNPDIFKCLNVFTFPIFWRLVFRS